MPPGEPDDTLDPDKSDEAKLLCLPEPRRSSHWLRMYLVACNGSFMQFEDLYRSYCDWFEPDNTQDSPNPPASTSEDSKSKSKQQADQQQQPQDLPMEEEETQEQQVSEEPLRSTKAAQSPTPPTTAPVVSRPELLRAISNTMHGVRIYTPGGRVLTWSSGVLQCKACSKLLMSGICYRKEPLTFAHTTRKKNLRRLK